MRRGGVQRGSGRGGSHTAFRVSVKKDLPSLPRQQHFHQLRVRVVG